MGDMHMYPLGAPPTKLDSYVTMKSVYEQVICVSTGGDAAAYKPKTIATVKALEKAIEAKVWAFFEEHVDMAAFEKLTGDLLSNTPAARVLVAKDVLDHCRVDTFNLTKLSYLIL